MFKCLNVEVWGAKLMTNACIVFGHLHVINKSQ